MLSFQLPPALAHLPQPILAVAGSQEATAVRTSLANFAARLPNSHAYLVPEAHHGWNGWHP